MALAELFSGLLPDDVGELSGPLELAFHRPAWHQRAACRGMPTEAFFQGREGSQAVTDAVVALCTDCPVRDDCREAATSRDDQGIWGGTNQRQRRQARREARLAFGPPVRVRHLKTAPTALEAVSPVLAELLARARVPLTDRVVEPEAPMCRICESEPAVAESMCEPCHAFDVKMRARREVAAAR